MCVFGWVVRWVVCVCVCVCVCAYCDTDVHGMHNTDLTNGSETSMLYLL